VIAPSIRLASVNILDVGVIASAVSILDALTAAQPPIVKAFRSSTDIASVISGEVFVLLPLATFS